MIEKYILKNMLENDVWKTFQQGLSVDVNKENF